MPIIESKEDAIKWFPSFKSHWFLANLLVFLEKYGLQSVEVEFYISIVGLVLTIAHIFILMRKSMMMSSIISVMIAIGICDALSMILAISVKDLTYNFYRDDCTPPLTFIQFHLFLIFVYFRENVIRCSTWLGILMAIIRYLSLRFVTRPGFKKLSKFAFGFYSAGCLFIFSSLLSFVSVMRSKVVEVQVWTPGEQCNFKSDQVYMLHDQKVHEFFTAYDGLVQRIFTFTNGILSKLIPCLLLPLFTILLVLEIRNARKQMTTASSLSVRQRTERTTNLVLFMTVTFFIASLPAGVFSVFQTMYTDFGFIFLSALVDHFCTAILTANASLHCFICFAMSSDYRETVKKILKIRQNKPQPTGQTVASVF